jgi:hypothetical protein
MRGPRHGARRRPTVARAAHEGICDVVDEAEQPLRSRRAAVEAFERVEEISLASFGQTRANASGRETTSRQSVSPMPRTAPHWRGSAANAPSSASFAGSCTTKASWAAWVGEERRADRASPAPRSTPGAAPTRRAMLPPCGAPPPSRGAGPGARRAAPPRRAVIPTASGPARRTTPARRAARRHEHADVQDPALLGADEHLAGVQQDIAVEGVRDRELGTWPSGPVSVI